MKICSKCKIEKELNEFHARKNSADGKRSACKTCRSEYNKLHKNREYFKQYHLANRTEKCKKAKEWKENNKERNLKTLYAWQEKNIKKKLKYQKTYRDSRKKDPIYVLAARLRSNLRTALKNKGFKKTYRTNKILGCSIKELEIHLKSTFELNYGIPLSHVDIKSLHVDHIIPVSSAKTEEELLKLNHYSNLQYLFSWDNMEKSNQLDWSLS